MKHRCGYCDLELPTAMEHATHVAREHFDPFGGITPPSKRLMRPTSCWRCAKDIPPGEDECPSCNAPHPRRLHPT